MTATPAPAAPPSPPSPPPRFPRARLVRLAARFAAGLAALAGLAWLAVPPLVRSVAQSQGSQALGRALHVGAAHFDPFTLTLRLDDVAIDGPRPGAPAALQLAHATLNAEWRSLWHLAPVLREVVIDTPVMRVARTGDGHYDFDDVLATLAKRPPAPADAPPAHFAVYNLQVRGGRVEFDDRPKGQKHRVEAFALDVPFLSDLPGDTEIKVQPRLSFTLDGARYDTQAQATPFRSERTGTVALRTGDIALAPWLPYWPASLGWKPAQGHVTVDATLAFDAPAGRVPRWTLGGRVGVDELALVDAQARPLVSWRRFELQMDSLDPLAQRAAFSRVAMDGLDVALDRDAQGVVNVVRAFAGAASASAAASTAPAKVATGAPASGGAPASAGLASGPAAASAPAGSASRWQVRAAVIELTGAHVAWRDAAVSPATQAEVSELQLHVANARWPLPPGPPASSPVAAAAAPSAASGTKRPAPAPGDAIDVHLRARWHAGPARAATVAPASASASAPDDRTAIAVDARIGAARSDATVSVDHLALAPLRPYLAGAWHPATEGDVGLHARLAWEGDPAVVLPVATVDALTVDGLRLRERAGEPVLVAWKHLALENAVVDLAAHRVDLASLAVVQPALHVERDAAGQLAIASWFAGSPSASASASPSTSTSTSTSSPASSATSSPTPAAASPWQARIARVTVDAGRVQWRDAPAAGPVAIDLDALQLAVADLAWPAAPGSLPVLKLGVRVKAGDAPAAAPAGRVDFDGRVGLAPVAWRGRLRVERLPLHLADAYLATASPLLLLHADLGWRGDVDGGLSDAGLRLHVRGDALLTDVHTRARHAADGVAAIAEDLVSWQSLGARATEATLAPGRPPVVSIEEVTLAKAFARLVVTEQGHFNLTDLAPPAASSTPPIPLTVSGSSPPTAAAPASAATSSAAAPAPATAPTAALAAASASAAAAAASAPPPDIRIGGVRWTDARIEYTDRFVKPNYNADLSALEGTLGAFSTRAPDLAPLHATGRIAGTGVLDIQGRVNPLAQPLALDLTARATDIELAPLSPYAGKYAGYGIERGKLSMNLHYQVQPDGRLEAHNQVILNQLTFGEPVDSPVATKLPVRFAVALLKDRNGVIDIDLPVSGSLNDPQFSVGGIVVKLIVNLLTKALTAPFALLGGGDTDLSQVLFDAGTARLPDDAGKALDRVAAALKDRPALQLTITGLADADQEHAALQAAELERQLASRRRTERLQAGEADVPATPTLTADDRARLLKRLYEDTKLPDKPRNVLGLAKDLPADEMATRLKAGLPLPPDAARQLAVQRAIVVRDALAARGLDNARLFVAAPKVHGAGAAEPGDWLPHAQLELSSK
jgi:hypothetical protein